jgi:acetyltransferase-like isoleucine patch superfamily enzyme
MNESIPPLSGNTSTFSTPAANTDSLVALLAEPFSWLCWLFKGVLYFLSFIGPLLAISRFRNWPVVALLAFGIAAYGFSALVFLSLLLLVKRLLLGHLRPTGPTAFHSTNGRQWIFASSLTYVLVESCFRTVTSTFSPLARFYLRGMGAKIDRSVLLAPGCRISDPWFVEFGPNVLVGAEAVILGHLGNGNGIYLGRVVIGEGSIVGMRSVIFPNVHVGRRVRIGAGSIVVSGTTIPDGETWAGVPARKLVESAVSDCQLVMPSS